MSDEYSYPEWRRAWPDVIVRTQTDVAVDYLQRYYGGTADQPSYTGSRFESVARLNPDPDTLSPADFVAVSMLSVSVPAEAAIRLIERDAETIRALLKEIPTDVDIVDMEPRALAGGDTPAGKLWNLLRHGRDGLGPTTTSKLLAAKRPRLFPIWDSFVERATGLSTVGYWWKFQYVLADDQRLVWEWLGELRSLATNVPKSITELRILDVILWMSIRDAQ